MRFFVLALLLASLSIIRAADQAGTPPAAAPDPALQSKAYVILENLRDANRDLAKGDNAGALTKVNAVLQADPKSIAGYLIRGAVYTNTKVWDKAQTDFETAHLLEPTNNVVKFNLAEVKFVQKMYDAARPGFLELESDRTDLGDLSTYKVFLCDLFGGHEDVASKQLAIFNQIQSNPSYFYANAASALYNHKPEDARGWLASANRIYPPQKNGFYTTSLTQLGYLPLPPPPAAN